MPDAPALAPNEIVERLLAFENLASLPRHELEWIANHGALVQYEAGQVLIEPGETIDMLWICLAGRIAIDIDRGAGSRRTMEWGAGEISGLLPYSRLSASPGRSHALEATELFQVDRSLMPELTRECPEFTAMTVHLMLDRARTFNTRDLHDEKMVSLGRLAAGLAHELNNPASAAVSAARALGQELSKADHAARALGAHDLTSEQIERVDEIREVCLANPSDASLSVTERADREDRILDWLEDRGADPDHAPALADTPATIETLDRLEAAVPAETLDATLAWIASGCAVKALALDIERAAHRIHDLVSAVKRFSYMDRAPVDETIDLDRSLRDTAAVLAAKARAKGADIRVRTGPDTPRVRGAGSELNQVWLNLVDNALHAIGESGVVEIEAGTESGRVVVSVIDDGPGVPRDLQARIFDPFFTTKEQGEGTGLGLDIALGIVRRHGGEIRLESEPGRTAFQVVLPAAR